MNNEGNNNIFGVDLGDNNSSSQPVNNINNNGVNNQVPPVIPTIPPAQPITDTSNQSVSQPMKEEALTVPTMDTVGRANQPLPTSTNTPNQPLPPIQPANMNGNSSVNQPLPNNQKNTQI